MQEMATMALVFKNYIWKVKGTIIAKTVLKKSNKGGRLTISAFKMRCKAALIKTVCGILAEGTGSAEIDKWESTDFFDKGANNSLEKGRSFQHMVLEMAPLCEKVSLNLYNIYVYL